MGNRAPGHILVVDDESSVRSVITDFLDTLEFRSTAAENGSKAIELMNETEFDVILTDLVMDPVDGMGVLEASQKLDPLRPVIFLTGHGTIETAVGALKRGAFDFLQKPFKLEELQHIVEQALNYFRLVTENKKLHDELSQKQKIEHLNKQLNKKLEQLTAIQDISHSISSELAFRPLLNTILKLTVNVLYANSGALFLCDHEDKDLLNTVASVGISDSCDQNMIRAGEGIVGETFQENEPILITDIKNDKRFKTRDAPFSATSYLIVPLNYKGEKIGVISVCRHKPRDSFQGDDLDLLSIIANQAAISISNASLFSSEERKVSELQTLYQIATQIGFVENDDMAIDCIVNNLRTALQVDYYAYFLWNEEKNGMELKHSFGLQEDLDIGSLVPWSLLKRPEEEDKKWKLASLDLVKAILNGENTNLKSDNIILEPLLSEGRVSGLIFLGNKDNHSYSEEEQQFIAIISSQIVGIYERFKTLIRYSNLATMGELTAGIAHDLKRPLSSISGMMYFLETRWEDREFCEETLETLKMELSRLTELTHQLSRFSSPQEFSRESRDPKEVFDHVLRLVVSEAEKKGIEIKTDYDPNQTQVMINFNQMVEAQINIISNSFQAMPDGGTLRIITRLMKESQVKPEESEAPGRKKLPAENFLRIAVSDTGVGIPRDHLNKIFNRFFTTKTSGTGLGLMITKRIIEAMGGTIFYTSEENNGTTCFIELPASVSAAPEEPEEIPASVQQPGN